MTPEQHHPDPNQAEGNGNSSKDSSVPNSGRLLSWFRRFLLGGVIQEQVNQEVRNKVRERVKEIFSNSEIEQIKENFEKEEIKDFKQELYNKTEKIIKELDKEYNKLFQQYKDLNSRVSRISGFVYFILISAAVLGGFALMQGGPIASIMSIDVLRADIADLKQDVRLLMDNQE